MLKRKKSFAVLCAAMALSLSLAGCGGAPAEDAKELKVWSHLTTQEIEAMKPIAEKWGQENGVKVTIVEDKATTQEDVQAIKAGKGPDIYFGAPHDQLGIYQKAGLLEEVPKDVINPADYGSEQIIQAVTIDGKQYALPIAQETVALFYNTDMVQSAPQTMEEVVAQGEKVGFKYDINNFYASYGFIAANGAYVFKNNNGTLDPNDIGLDTEGAVKGYTFIQNLVIKDKLMSADIKGDIAKGDFLNKNTGFYISGPWDVQAFKDGGVNFAVAPMPTLDGNKVPTFMGVQTAFVSTNTKDKELAWKLAKYLTENSGEIVLTKGNRVPVLKKDLDSKIFEENKDMAAFAEQLKVATPMPNIPQVTAMWEPAANNLQLLTSGKITPQECGKNIVEQIKQGIAQQK